LGTLSPGRRHPIHGPQGTPVPATAPPHAIVPETVSHARVSCSGVSKRRKSWRFWAAEPVWITLAEHRLASILAASSRWARYACPSRQRIRDRL